MRVVHAELVLFSALCALSVCPTATFLSPYVPARTCGGASRRSIAGRRRGGADANRGDGTAALGSAGGGIRPDGGVLNQCFQRGREEYVRRRRHGMTVGVMRTHQLSLVQLPPAAAVAASARKRGYHSFDSRLGQQAAPGLPEGDEGIADLASLPNPAKDKDYGDESALQYGVSVGAEAAGAGAAHHFFSADTRVVFGVNALEIGLVELYDMGLKRAMIVTGWNQARADPVVWELLPRGFDLKWHSVSAEPSLSDVSEGASLALEHRADCVVAMGGAAVIDAAKVIAAVVYADRDSTKAARRLLAAASKPREEAFPGGGRRGDSAQAVTTEGPEAPLLGPVPLVAIPIIAGIGSEVTPMATILDDNDPLEPQQVTVGFHNTAAAMPAPFMAIVEPRLMMRVPLETTWPRAFVALAGCLEAYVAGRGFVPDLMSHHGIERVSACLARDLGFRGPLYQEREDIAFAGVIRGLVVSRTEWSFLHRLASAVAVVSNAPYASCVARLFPRVLQAQIAELRREEEAYMDPARRRRARARRSGVVPKGASVGGGDVDAVDDDSSGPGGGGGREKTYSDDYNSRACAVLLKYQRVAGFVLGGGRGAEGGGGGKRTRKQAAAADGNDGNAAIAANAGSPFPEDVVEWLDARLLDKNIPPLNRMGLRPEHTPAILEALSRAGHGGLDGDPKATEAGASSAFGGLGKTVVKEIVVGEAIRRDVGGGVREAAPEGGIEAEEVPPEVTAAIAAMFGEGRGQGDQTRTETGPWQKK